MDCEKFDEDVMDAMYGELDELTLAALRRHVDSCGRCAGAYEGLTRTREDAVLPVVEPSAALEGRILEAERAVYGRAPWYRKVVRAAAWAGSHAMRPQLAMAALFMFVIGSSVLLLRARPGTVAAPVQVDERGAPEVAHATRADESPVGQAPAAAPRSPRGGMGDDEDGAARDRQKLAVGEVPSPGAGADATAAPADASASIAAGPARAPADDLAARLAEARTTRERSGCSAAAPSFEALARTHPDSDEGKQAERELDACRMTAAKSPPRPAPPASTAPNASGTTSPPPSASTGKPPSPGVP